MKFKVTESQGRRVAETKPCDLVTLRLLKKEN